jgi:hypothetical protein
MFDLISVVAFLLIVMVIILVGVGPIYANHHMTGEANPTHACDRSCVDQ